MSRYPASDYRTGRERSRSPPRFPDRRPSAVAAFDSRSSAPPPPRNSSDAPRGPRSQFDGPSRAPLLGGLGPAAGGPRALLRDLPPSQSVDRERSLFRDRDYDRRDRLSSRERSPARGYKDPRDLLPSRDLDGARIRRTSRDGLPPAGSAYPDAAPFSSAPSFRGGPGRGRGRGDYEYRSTRGARRALDDRDLSRRDRSPPPRFGRDLSRDGREPERRDERRFDRREDDRRQPEWLDRDREPDRSRRDPLTARLEPRLSNDTLAANSAQFQHPPAPPVNSDRLAILESAGADASARRLSTTPVPTSSRRDVPSESPAYLDGRAETTANRYGSRGSSPPTQAPPVPAFSFYVAPNAAAPSNSVPQRTPTEVKPLPIEEDTITRVETRLAAEEKPLPPHNAPTAPKAAPVAPRAQLASPPPAAPKAPRSLAFDPVASNNRLQGVRSLESLAPPSGSPRADILPPNTGGGGGGPPTSPGASRHSMSHLAQPVSPHLPQAPRNDLPAPTGPKATRSLPNHAAASPRPPLTSPRSDNTGHFGSIGFPRASTPPPSAPSGPRQQSFSVSPKATHTNIPTAPKASRIPPSAPRVADRGPQFPIRAPDRALGPPPLVPSAPRPQWNQWRRPNPSGHADKLGPSIPAKRDAAGEEKERSGTYAQSAPATSASTAGPDVPVKAEEPENRYDDDKMDVDDHPPSRRSTQTDGHSAAQSFFGGALKRDEEELDTSSEEDEFDDDATLLEAKHAREERELRAQMIDLSSREYRATTPLESIARLARISLQDLQRLRESKQDVEMEDRPASSGHLAPPAAHSESDDGPDVPTPRGESGASVVIREQPDGVDHIRRGRRRSPELIALPYLIKGDEVPHLQDTEYFQDNVRVLEESGPEILAALEDEVQAEMEADEDVDAEFDDYYRVWRQECEDLDWQQEKQERLERQLSAEPGPELDAPIMPLLVPIMEGRRLHKNSSEYEIEQVLKQSEETARIEQEKLDREAKKNQADMEKEARLPDQDPEEVVIRSVLIDTNRHRSPDSLTLVFSYEPPADTFTEAEQSLFIAAFKDTPKKWGEIASLLPDRTYRDCIHHYYANKWDGRFRDNRAKKFKSARRGRGGKPRVSRGSALMADLRSGDDVTQATATSDSGRPKRAAAPTTFGEREIESKTSLATQSPAKKPGATSRLDSNGDFGPDRAKRSKPGKPGRKAKGSQITNPPAGALPPQGKQFLPTMYKDERAQHLEDASLLTDFSAGQHSAAPADGHVMLNPEGYMPPHDVHERPKPSAASAKQGASSYWSVPEQADFSKYIAHFGTDFAAIAAHMGTKTQTMIKNHYQRRLDGDEGAELEELASKANARRERGEDIGPPPTPTPIIKRKYDSAPQGIPRTLAPNAELMDIDEVLPTPSAAPPAAATKHTSPPQFQTKPRFNTSAQSTPMTTHRVVPSPVPASSTPNASAMAAGSQPRALSRPNGSAATFLPQDLRPDSHAAPHYRFGPDSTAPSSLPLSQPGRTLSTTPLTPQFIHNLNQEQQKAMHLVEQEKQKAMHLERQERIEQQSHQRQSSAHVPRTHGSPLVQPLHSTLPDRKPVPEERQSSPPRSGLFSVSRPLFGPSASGSLGPSPLPMGGRYGYNQPPAKPETSRPGSGPAGPITQPGPVVAKPTVAVAEAPKRSNLLSLLNAESDDSKPAPQKRDSIPSASTRVASPAPQMYPSSSTPKSLASGLLQSSRGSLFGQTSLSGSHMHHPSYPPQSSTPTAPGAGMKLEPPTTSASDWHPRLHTHSSAPSPPSAPLLDRDGRSSYFGSHRSALSTLGQPTRINPSPPPHPGMHSRTSSLTTQPNGPPAREHRYEQAVGGPPSAQLHHSNPYGGAPQQPSNSPLFQASREEQNRLHHSQNNALHGGRPLDGTHPMGLVDRLGFAPRVHPGSSGGREEVLRRNDDDRGQREYEHGQREREHGRDMRMHYEAVEADRAREQQYQDMRYAQQPPPPPPPASSFARPTPMHPSAYNQPPFGSSRTSYGVREQSIREADATMHEHMLRQQDSERRRQHEEMYMREREREQREAPSDAMRRGRLDDPPYSRRTTPSQPLHGYPPPGRR